MWFNGTDVLLMRFLHLATKDFFCDSAVLTSKKVGSY